MKFVLSLVPFLATFSTDELDLGWSLAPLHPVAMVNQRGPGGPTIWPMPERASFAVSTMRGFFLPTDENSFHLGFELVTSWEQSYLSSSNHTSWIELTSASW